MPAKYHVLKEHCIGRNIVQLPDAFFSSDIATGYFTSGNIKGDVYPFDVAINAKNLTVEEFSNYIHIRTADLKNKDMGTLDVLRAEKKLSDVATLFRIQRVDNAFTSELYFLLNENLIIVKLDSFHNTYLGAEDRLVKFMSDFSITDRSKSTGFCLGAFSIQGNFVKENGGAYFRDDAGNTYDIKIDTYATDDGKGLLRRMLGPDSLLSLFHIGHTVLRSGERAAAGMRAQEWLGWTNLGEDGDEKTFKFVLETMRPKGSKATPSIQITYDSAKKLENGTETKTNLSDDEAIAIWDKVVNSIQAAN